MLKAVRLAEAQASFVGAPEPIEDLRLRPPGDDEARVGSEQGFVVVEGFEEVGIEDLRGRGRGRLGPPGGNGGRIVRGLQDILNFQAVPVLFRRVQFGRLCEGLCGLLRPAELLEDLRAVCPGPFQGRVRFKQSVEVYELLREPVRLRGHRVGSDPLPPREEVFHDALRGRALPPRCH